MWGQILKPYSTSILFILYYIPYISHLQSVSVKKCMPPSKPTLKLPHSVSWLCGGRSTPPHVILSGAAGAVEESHFLPHPEGILRQAQDDKSGGSGWQCNPWGILLLSFWAEDEVRTTPLSFWAEPQAQSKNLIFCLTRRGSFDKLRMTALVAQDDRDNYSGWHMELFSGENKNPGADAPGEIETYLFFRLRSRKSYLL